MPHVTVTLKHTPKPDAVYVVAHAAENDAIRAKLAADEPNGVYVAGPMTGLPDYNYPAFHAAAAELRSRGMVVANPAEHFDGNQTLPYGVYIREAVRSLIGCTEVVTLPGWENSRGARLEVDIAEKIGMPVTTLAEKLATADDTPKAEQ